MNRADPAYTHLAQYYDRLMAVDYREWVGYLEEIWTRLGVKPRQILELGAGAGGIAIPLAQMGYELVAVDSSPAMVAVAREKAAKAGVAVEFVTQAMEDINLGREFDLILCCCDAVNYLTSVEQLARFMRQAWLHAKPGGLLLFDVNSELKLREIYGSQSYAELFDDFGYFWDNSFDEGEEICTMRLTFLIRDQGGLYRRVSEIHREKLWRPHQIFAMLEEHRWEVKGYWRFPTFSEPTGEEERWQFAAIKTANKT
jgi:SAM-dependent methyltransferase